MPKCPYCDVEMNSRRRKQCGAPECKRRFNADRMRAYYRSGQITPHRTVYVITCVVCGDEHRTECRRTKHCNMCQKGLATRAAAEKRRDEYKKRHTQVDVYRPTPWYLQITNHLPIHKPLRRRWYAGYCIDCGAPFVHDQPQTRTCTVACQRRLAKDRRRARKVAAFVAPVSRKATYERDNWICHLCGDPVNREAQVPELDAPVIDHVLPLARGGKHCPENVRTAHFYCNSVKSDRLDVA